MKFLVKFFIGRQTATVAVAIAYGSNHYSVELHSDMDGNKSYDLKEHRLWSEALTSAKDYCGAIPMSGDDGEFDSFLCESAVALMRKAKILYSKEQTKMLMKAMATIISEVGDIEQDPHHDDEFKASVVNDDDEFDVDELDRILSSTPQSNKNWGLF